MGQGRPRSPGGERCRPGRARGLPIPSPSRTALSPAKDGAAVTDPGDGLSLDMVTAALRADSADVTIYARVLTESLGAALPAGWVTIDRERRTMSDRRAGRPGQVSKITVRMGDRVMTLGVERGAPVAEICREVRGVV